MDNFWNTELGGFMKKNIMLIYAVVGSLSLLFFFQNCSQRFKFAESQSLSSLKVSSITVNNDATYTASDKVAVQITVDNAEEMYITNSPDCSTGGEWQPLASEIPWQLGEKNISANVYAKFRSIYKTETACVSDSIIHDDIPPVLTLAQTLPVVTNAANFEMKLSMSDDGSGIDKLICPKEVSSCTPSMPIANNEDGVKIMTFTVTDKAGNISLPLVPTWIVDKTPPTLNFVMTPPSKTNQLVASFTVNATDNYSQTSAITYKRVIDTQAAADFKLSGLAPGSHNFKVVAYDEVGNASPEISYSWLIGIEIPNIRFIQTPTPYSNILGQFTFTGEDQFKGPLVKFQCSLNNVNFADCVSPHIPSALLPGKNNFRIRGYDSLDQVSGILEYNWVYDTTAPVLAFEIKPNEFTKNKSEPVKVIVTEAEALDSIEFLLDNVVVSKALLDSVVLANLTEAKHNITVFATDKAGNKSAPISSVFTSDFTAPVVTIAAVPTPTNLQNLSIPVSAVDNVVDVNNIISFFYDLDAANAFAPFNPPLVLKDLINGPHQFKVYAIDKAGNQSVPVFSNSFMVDIRPPTITFIKYPSTSLAAGSTTNIEYLIQDIESGLKSTACALTINNIPQLNPPCPANGIFSLKVSSIGTYVYTLTAIDNVGNESTKSISWLTAPAFQDYDLAFDLKANINNKVDILFVIDNSGSMAEEQLKIQAAFANFTQNLAGLQWRIGITTTDATANGANGSLIPIKPVTSGLYFIEPTTVNGQQLLVDTLYTGTGGSGSEIGLTVIDRFLGKAFSVLNNLNERAFLRPDAVFASIVVTDSDEAQYTGGFRDALTFLNAVKLKIPNKPYIHHSSIILPTDSATCKASGEHVGSTYFNVSRDTGGISASICSADYGSQLKDFAVTIVNKISEKTLACAPVDSDGDGKVNIKITYMASVAAVPVEITAFTLLNNIVSFTAPLSSAGDYLIKYSCLIAVP